MLKTSGDHSIYKEETGLELPASLTAMSWGHHDNKMMHSQNRGPFSICHVSTDDKLRLHVIESI